MNNDELWRQNVINILTQHPNHLQVLVDGINNGDINWDFQNKRQRH